MIPQHFFGWVIKRNPSFSYPEKELVESSLLFTQRIRVQMLHVPSLIFQVYLLFLLCTVAGCMVI